MSAPVDVLAVMAVAAPHYPPLNEARAAVAELIEQARTALQTLQNVRAAGQIGEGYGNQIGDLAKALARVGGAA